jgi:hypothetical protein
VVQQQIEVRGYLFQNEISLLPKPNSGTAYNMVGAAVKGIGSVAALPRAPTAVSTYSQASLPFKTNPAI